MVGRIIKTNKNNSFFVFGARGTGKTTWLQQCFVSPRTLWINLLQDEQVELYRKNLSELTRQLESGKFDWVVIDEVQKLPKLLDRVHMEIEKRSALFVLTGSSARKLKRGAANLLGGRAFTYHMYPFSFLELGQAFDLDHVLRWGSLPKILEFGSDESAKKDYLRSYVQTYLKEEIVAEQIVRKLDPFRDFLPIVAQQNGDIINYKKIANDIGVDDKTVKSFFQILDDTLVGFHLNPFHRSVRKRQRQSPKFYLLDTGVKRALEQKLNLPIEEGYAYGKAFEHRLVLEAHWLNDYHKLDYRFSYLRTKDDAEIDLIIERPGLPDLLVEIKSTQSVRDEQATALGRFLESWPKKAEAHIWSRDPSEKKIGACLALHWQEGLRRVFGESG